jgi:hypothetical protein
MLNQGKPDANRHRFGISTAAMIAGNPKSGRTVAALVLILLIVVSTAIIALRNRTPRPKVVPLHPSMFIVRAN